MVGIHETIDVYLHIHNFVVLLYDIHWGKSHHRHLRGQEEPYEFVDEDRLLDDFLRDIDLI